MSTVKMHLLVGIDFSESSNVALAQAVALATRLGARLHLGYIAHGDGQPFHRAGSVHDAVDGVPPHVNGSVRRIDQVSPQPQFHQSGAGILFRLPSFTTKNPSPWSDMSVDRPVDSKFPWVFTVSTL